jgi:hypothetical protein
VIKVKTFTSPLTAFHVKGQLETIDDLVNAFIEENNVKTVASVSDTITTDDSGSSIGIIRVLAYE